MAEAFTSNTRTGWLEPIAASTERFIATVGRLTDDQVHAETLIPPWTRGHVITHVCRAGDSLMRLLSWARTGIEVPQYPSMEARAADIEAGAGRSVSELMTDLVDNGVRFADAVRALSEVGWQRQVRPRTGELRTAETLIPMRLRELEIHHVDLDAGYSFPDIPVAAARWILDDIADALDRRGTDCPALRLRATDSGFARDPGAAETRDRIGVTGTQADLLAWLSGRVPAENADLVADGADTIPVAPVWI
ncbi:maleylpyruvate isomerase family mycothiol-dependent enzyme [Nocardia sp. CA-145437]|uniref:maleylpyruvate isomerase family mycothiol-dependent enzyme n=1 Tax=Nocardia sp. CA-145437 TaxID=3239980 RepID=UPI003D95A949